MADQPEQAPLGCPQKESTFVVEYRRPERRWGKSHLIRRRASKQARRDERTAQPYFVRVPFPLPTDMFEIALHLSIGVLARRERRGGLLLSVYLSPMLAGMRRPWRASRDLGRPRNPSTK